ncbi:MAG: phenylalanine--tRNA ligase subunit alpha [Candidatus Cloacimonetes bacterium]|nr:phenylalanine--tRNA ligase subunit alpha [Candidatus Cloacimonadota bacterium]
MNPQNRQLQEIVARAEGEIGQAANLHDLQLVKSRWLGKKSELQGLMKLLGGLPKEERPAFGQRVNQAKSQVGACVRLREETLKEADYLRTLEERRLDITMPGRRRQAGALHPITLATRFIEDVCISMGFEVAEGPDIEDEYHNFDALNTPDDHPARDLSDTFYIEDDVLLRTQTSTVQIRVMETHKPPIRIIAPGRCYRNDNDASHSPVFSQLEALVVDKGVTFADFRDTVDIFTKRVFGEQIESRFRPHFFPFTEPSAELDILCSACKGSGCNVCKGSGWLELGGAGMVDPNVFRACGIDPEVYSGYAFGFGIERVAMLLLGIPDMRMLFENDVRMLRQFRSYKGVHQGSGASS